MPCSRNLIPFFEDERRNAAVRGFGSDGSGTFHRECRYVINSAKGSGLL